MKAALWILFTGVTIPWILSCGQSPVPKSADDAKADQLTMAEATTLENGATTGDTSEDAAGESELTKYTDDNEDNLESEDVYGGQYEDDGEDDNGDDDDHDDDEAYEDDAYED